MLVTRASHITMPFHHSPWVKLEADDFSAVVSSSSILAHASSGFLAHQAEFALAQDSRHAAVRLDCSSDVAKEVVQLLRLGPSHYAPPSDTRLLRALQHQLDYLGISCACVGSHTVADAQKVLLLPSYFAPAMPSSSSNDSSSNSSRSGGGPLLIYSSGAGGWTLKTAEKVPRLQSLEGVGSYIGSSSVKVAVLRAESIGSGELSALKSIQHLITNSWAMHGEPAC